ncbi:MAG: hypothetical protein H8E66_30095 [Planctomycetes bacterium]|nr:hypothetical protein [Planctomycetota bacterium]
MADPNIVFSGLSMTNNECGLDLRIDIYRLEDNPTWSLEVIDDEGTSTVWDELFETDQEALDEALKTIRDEGASAFRDPGNVVKFPR